MVLPAALGNCQQFQHIAHLSRIGNIHRRNFRDAFTIDLAERYARVEGKARHNRELIGRVQSLDIGGWVRFSQPQLLCIVQHGFVVLAVFVHTGKDVVRRAVDDAHQRINAVRLQGLHEGVDNRNCAADARFVVQTDVVALCSGLQAVPIQGNGDFVRRDNGLAVFQRAEHVVRRRLFAAHEFDNDADFRVAHHVVGVRCQQFMRHTAGAGFVHIAHQHSLDADGETVAVSNLAGKACQQRPHAPANIAAAQKSDYNFLHFVCFLLLSNAFFSRLISPCSARR